MIDIVDEGDECIHGLGEKSACVICNGRERQEKDAQAEILYHFRSQFESKLWCGHSVDVGDDIAKRADGTYVCGDCANRRD